MRIAAVTAALFLTVSTVSTQAADVADVYETPPAESGWTFTFAPYAWAASIKGEVGLFGFEPQDIDASISDVLKNFDIGAMAVMEARNDRFLLGADIFYANLGTEVDTPFGIAAESIDVEATSGMFTGFVGYSLIYNENVNLDVIAGARVWHSNTAFDFEGGLLDGDSADDGDTWVDPLVGMKGRAEIGSGFYLTGWGMIPAPPVREQGRKRRQSPGSAAAVHAQGEGATLTWFSSSACTRSARCRRALASSSAHPSA